MATFLTTQATSYYLEDIITHADQWLIIISPYLKITENFLQRLQDADKKKVSIIIIYGKDELRPDEKKKLQKLDNLSLRYFKNLHAKCFLNEKSMIITSMNMHEFSEKTNREMGVLIQKDTDSDQKIYEDAMREINSILNSAKEEDVSIQPKGINKRSADNSVVYRRTSVKTGGLAKAGEALKGFLKNISEKEIAVSRSKHGYCIRCRKKIPYNTDRPYCRECFFSWYEWENPAYIEKYCHTCGNRDKSSMLYPQCRSCFYKS